MPSAGKVCNRCLAREKYVTGATDVKHGKTLYVVNGVKGGKNVCLVLNAGEQVTGVLSVGKHVTVLLSAGKFVAGGWNAEET